MSGLKRTLYKTDRVTPGRHPGARGESRPGAATVARAGWPGRARGAGLVATRTSSDSLLAPDRPARGAPM